MMRISGLTLGFIFTAVSLMTPCFAAEKASAPVIELDSPTYAFGQVSEGEVVTHDFKVSNRGDAVLEIKEVKPG